MAEDRGGIEIETLDGMALLEEVLAVIGAEIRMPPHQHLVVGGGVEVPDGEGTERETVTMITGEYHHLEEIAILRHPDVVLVAGGTVGEVEEGRGTRDLVARSAETPGTIEDSIQMCIRARGRPLYDSLSVEYTAISDL